MNITENGQGYLRTNLSGELSYKSFVPTPLKQLIPLHLDEESLQLLTACSRKLGELEGMLKFLPNASMYLAMYVRKEALLSAQIEGTQCTFDDILDPERSELTHKDVADVVNYVAATEYAVNRMKTLPLCIRLLRETHEVLISQSRGFEKNPGEVRTSQNWIGPAGCTLKNAAYVPPNVEDMACALSELERFMNEASDVDPIIKAALIHYQFETIHPFLDGNGRLGRLLITLSLMNDNVLSAAVFYPSYQLKLQRSEYYESLMTVRMKGDYGQWLRFFCNSLRISAQDAIDALNALVSLHDVNTKALSERFSKSSTHALNLLTLLEQHPIIDAAFISEKLDISRTTAGNLIKGCMELGILKQREEGKQRYRTFIYETYLEILRQGGDPL